MNQRFRLRSVVLASCILVVGGGAQVSASTTTVEDVAADGVPVVVEGTSSGRPGDQARLLISEAATPEGSAKSVVIAQTSVGQDGSFSIGMSDIADLATRANSDGFVNALVAIPTRAGEDEVTDVVLDIHSAMRPKLQSTLVLDAAQGLPLPDRQKTASFGVAADGSGQSNDSGVDGVPETVPVKFKAQSDVERSASSSASGLAPANDYYCSDRYHSWVATPLSFIGGTYSTNTGARQRLTVSQSASSNFGVGVSATGTKGSFSASGQRSVTHDDSTAFPVTRSTKSNYTLVGYNKYKRVCTNYTQGYTKTTYPVRPSGLKGGAESRSRTSLPNAWTCGKYDKGTTFTANKARAWTNSWGVPLSGAIGINLSAQTGYSNEAKISITADQWAVKICGEGGRYPYDAKRVVVRSAG